MDLLSIKWIGNLTIVLLGILLLLYKYMTRNFSYWKNLNVPHLKPFFPSGNLAQVMMLKKTATKYFFDLYRSTNQPFLGIFIFDQPVLLIRSQELIKHILVKDFNNFYDRFATCNKDIDVISTHILFFSKNPDWKYLRSMMTPAFSSKKIKTMIPLIDEIKNHMENYITQKTGKPTDAKILGTKFFVDVISTCAFGINANALRYENAKFYEVATSIFAFKWSTALQHNMVFFLPKFSKLFRARFLPKSAEEFFRHAYREVTDRRKESGSKRGDFVDTLIQFEKEADDQLHLNENKLVGQAAMYFIAGYETSSTIMGFLLYEFSLHQDYQNRARDEIQNMLGETKGDITYNDLQGLEFLELCILETLRKYPVIPFLDRICANDYKLPGTEIVLKKGTPIIIPLMGVHYDETFYEDPFCFNPERFAGVASNYDPFTMMAFGEGPRACTGKKFAIMALKLGFVYILSKFKVSSCSNTPQPVQFEPKCFTAASKTGLPVIFEKI